jgi:hypothetical protein
MLNRFDERGCEKMENKRSGQIRLIICREGSQGQPSRAAELQEEDHIRFRMFEWPIISDRFESYPYVRTSSCILVTTYSLFFDFASTRWVVCIDPVTHNGCVLLPIDTEQPDYFMYWKNVNIMFCWPCIVTYQYSTNNEMHVLYSVYYELTASTRFEHYFHISRRLCVNKFGVLRA